MKRFLSLKQLFSACILLVLVVFLLIYLLIVYNVLQINLLERPELPQRMKLYCLNRGPPEHWLFSGMYKRVELQKALGTHLSWKDR
jgi:hypothetical protein